MLLSFLQYKFLYMDFFTFLYKIIYSVSKNASEQATGFEVSSFMSVTQTV